VEVVASLSQGRTAAAQCGLFTHKSVPVIFEPPCISGKVNSRLYTERWKGLDKNGPCPISKYCPYNMLAESVRNMKHHEIQYLLEDKSSF